MEKELRINDLLAYIRNERWKDVNTILHDSEIDTLNKNEKSTLLTELSFHREASHTSLLINKGADPNFCFKINHTMFSYDLNRGTTPLGQTILGSERNNNPTLDVMEKLLLLGANPNLITYSGYTPLQLSIVFNRPEYAVILLLNGANPYHPSTDDDQPDSFYFAKNQEWAKHMLYRWKKWKIANFLNS